MDRRPFPRIFRPDLIMDDQAPARINPFRFLTEHERLKTGEHVLKALGGLGVALLMGAPEMAPWVALFLDVCQRLQRGISRDDVWPIVRNVINQSLVAAALWKVDPAQYPYLATLIPIAVEIARRLGFVKVPAVAMLLGLALFATGSGPASAGEISNPAMNLSPEVRQRYYNTDGSCVQCSLGMCGADQNVPQAATLLWDSEYGPAERGGSRPSRVAEYCERRGIHAWNVVGPPTFAWMKWAVTTGRGAAIGASPMHFQTLYGYDPERKLWLVCNNQTPQRIDAYTEDQFRRLHLSCGIQWAVILDANPRAPVARYDEWWK